MMATFCCFAEDKASVAFCLLPYLLEKKTKKTPTPQDYLYQVTAKYLYYLVSVINIRVSMYTLTVYWGDFLTFYYFCMYTIHEIDEFEQIKRQLTQHSFSTPYFFKKTFCLHFRSQNLLSLISHTNKI